MKQHLLEICEEFATSRNYSGTCLVKSGNETILSFVCGLAHAGFAVPNRIDTKFNTASVGKVFTAVATLQLIEQGAFSFSDAITELVDLSGTMIPGDVTIEHLLTHTSGIANDVDLESGQEYEDLFLDKPNYAIRNTVDFLPNFVWKEPEFKAGTRAAYSDCAFILLGLAIEEYSGKDYRTYVDDAIIRPLGLLNTAFCTLDGINENTAEGYTTVCNDEGIVIGMKKNIYLFPPVGTPDAGIYSTVEDMDTFIRSFRANTLLSEKYSMLMMRPHSTLTWQDQWGDGALVDINPGYGFDFTVNEDGTVVSMSKDGVYPGAMARMMLYPAIDVSVCILSNQNCNIFEMHRRMEQSILTEFDVKSYR